MSRLRALLAFGLSLGLAGCANADRRVATRSSRPWPVGFGAEPRAGSRVPVDALARSGRPDLVPSAGRPVGGVARYFPGLVSRGPEFVMPDRPSQAAAPPESYASRANEPAGVADRPDPVRPSLARRQAAALPVALNAETYPEPDSGRSAPASAGSQGAIVAARSGPRDEEARRVEAEADAEAQPDVAESAPSQALEGAPEAAEAVPPVAEVQAGSDETKWPGATGTPPGEAGDDEDADDAPPPVAEAGDRPDDDGPQQPAGSNAPAPSLAGRPRMPLVRPTGLPADLPPPTFPPSYYGPAQRQALPPSGPPSASPRDMERPTRRRWRLGLIERLRSAIGGTADSAGPEPGHVAQGR